MGRECQNWQTSLSSLYVRGLVPLNGSAIDEVGLGGHFLGCDQTMCTYQNVFYELKVISSENVESWEAASSKEI